MIRPLRFFQFPVGGLLISLGLVPAYAQQVVSTQPSPNANAVPRNSPISLTSSEALPASAVLNVFSAQTGGKKAGSSQVTGSTSVFTPAIGFRPGERVLVTGSGISAGGLSHVFEFTTAVNRGTGAFFGNDFALAGYNPVQVTSGDVDGDGDLDLVTANADDYSVNVRLNNGHGRFSGATRLRVADGSPLDVKCADIDGDGDLDIVTANYGSNYAGLFFNDGKGNFWGSLETDAYIGNLDSNNPNSVTCTDIDGDGDLDILASKRNGNSSVAIRFNDGHGRFSGSAQIRADNNPVDVTTADVDGDGDMDLLVANGSSTNNVSIRLNDGKGNFSGSTEVRVGIKPTDVAVADLDGDGDLDLLATIYENNTVSELFNDGKGNFSGSTQIDVGLMPVSVTTGDYDGDGDIDFLTANVYENSVSVRLNRSPLPVHLTDFAARLQVDWVQLSWKTSWETKFSGFEMQRSTDALEFTSIGWVTAQPNAVNGASYGFHDLSLPPTASALYYRLKLVDLDGSVSYSTIRSVSQKTLGLGMLVLGNPVRGSLKLMLSSPLAQSVQLNLYSTTGQLVHQQALTVGEGRSEWALDLGPVGAGAYELVLSDNISRQSQRLVIE
ncbi:FG-GAP-like repeat-containing protein [Spirosoma sp. RP8]|uniref:FG-GAP-like repeat-containing protein n=1 Tax=Spirosoma liriopis TaxID=2937440 RepID=A0ABT0HTV4_9BACT|nr:FG-GAP-like repeat-containing protein [Spirosoma liriopis]MCK8495277.1 FG-GAP-like repeat-containing protein [Spirosoma liriopis]